MIIAMGAGLQGRVAVYRYLIGFLLVLFAQSGWSGASEALGFYQRGYQAESRGAFEEAIEWYRKAIAERDGDGRITFPGEVSYEWYETPRGMARRKIESASRSEPYFPAQRMNALLAKQEAAQIAARSQQQKRDKFINPPALRVAVELLDAGNDRIVDGGENGKLLVTLTNHGGSAADNVVLTIRRSDSDLSLPSQIPLGTVGAGDSVVRAIAYQAGKRLSGGTLSLRLTAKDSDGFEAPESVLESVARAYQPARILVRSPSIRRGEGNLLIISYELVNAGRGAARDVDLTLNLQSDAILRDDADRHRRIAAISPGESLPVEFGLYTSRAPGDGLEIGLTVREAQATSEQDTSLALMVPAGAYSSGGELLANSPPLGASEIENVSLAIPQGLRSESLAVGVVIGNGRYRHLDAVRFAHQDARVISDHVVQAMGYPEEGVKLQQDMTTRDFRRLFGTRERGFRDGLLYRRVELNARRRENPPVFVYYSGHGAPSLDEDGKAYLVPVDTTLRDLPYEGYALEDFYDSLAALPSNNVTVVLDACFSGASNDGLLQKDISPALLRSAGSITPASMSEASIFTSTSPNQVSYWFNEGRHSLFTYFFLKGLRGAADDDGDNRITSGELHQYLGWNVADHILETRKPSDQTPQLVGNKDRLLAVYSGEQP